MQILINLEHVHLWASFGETITLSKGIVYMHEGNCEFCVFGHKHRRIIPPPSTEFIEEITALNSQVFSSVLLNKFIECNWISRYVMETLKLKCLLRWVFKMVYYSVLFQVPVRRKRFAAHRLDALRAVDRISEPQLRKEIICKARFW